LNTQTQQMYIGGKWMSAASGETMPSVNPATGEIIGYVPKGGRAEARWAIDSAYEAFKKWSGTTAFFRAELLLKVEALILENSESLAKRLTMEQGKPLYEAKMEVANSAEQFRWFAEEAKRINGETLPPTHEKKRVFVIKQPLGVVAAITPWNFPLHIICRKIAAALAAGCTVVVKPSEETPLIALALAELFDRANFPPGVVNFVTGIPEEIGQELFHNRKVAGITFTGSTKVGKLILKECADTVKRVHLELGGHAPVIVFEDADVDLAVEGTLINKLRNAGQTCVCANRIYVHRKIADDYIGKLAAKMQAKVLGNGLEENVDLGPLINKEALDKVERHVRDAVDKGAKMICGGERARHLPGGYYFLPTILRNVHEDMDLMKEETFGPVAPILEFDDESKLIERINDTPNGLAAYFYTNDLARVFRISEQLEFGVIGVNDTTPVVSHGPFGGLKESGIGREGGKEGIEEFLESKFVSIRLES